ncbi:MAG: DUF2207 domain-containing protein [Longimicrobiales bacterium]
MSSISPARFRSLPTTLALALLVFSGVAAELGAQSRDISLDRFEQDIQVRSDGSFQVREQLTVGFEGSWNGIERDLLSRMETAEGRSTRARYRIGEVTDGSGAPLEVEESGISDGRRLRIWVPGAEDALRTVVLNYTVEGGLRFWTEELLAQGRAGPDAPAEPFDELYWNSTGHEWEMPIRQAVVRVRLPHGVEELQAWGYTGRVGSTEQAVEVTTGAQEAEIRTTRSLAPREGLTVSVTWPPGVVDRPTAADRAVEHSLLFWPVGIPPLALIVMFLTWRAHGRDPDRRRLMVHYHPPEDLSPAEVGTLADHDAEMHDLTSTLVDLAVRGYLTIEEKERSGLLSWLPGGTDYEIHQRRPRSSWTELRPHERRYLEGLFPGTSTSSGIKLDSLEQTFSLMADGFRAWREAKRSGEDFDGKAWQEDWARERDLLTEAEPEEEEPLESVKLSELRNRFYKHIDPIKSRVYRRLKKKGLYDGRPDRAKQKWAGIGFGLLVAGGITGIVLASRPLPLLAPHPLAAGGGIAGAGLVVLLFSRFMGVRTEKGVRALEEILGFRQFLERVEAPEYRRMITSPDLFEKYLPYAMALEAEDRWAKAFEDLYRSPPDWYQGSTTGSNFHTTAFTRQMRSFSSSAGKTMSSSPSSSSSSGSGGGGSSGGGGGGGGGRGF